VPNASPETANPRGVPIDAIIFGGRVREREPLIRALRDAAEGVYDGLTLGAEATAAAEGKAGVLRYDPMSMRPFLSYSEGQYAQRWLDVIGQAKAAPIFAHVNWFQREANGRYVWPGYGENLRPLLWLLDLAAGRVKGRKTPIGVLPEREEMNLEGLSLSDADLHRLLNYDSKLWRDEMAGREEHLSQFPGLPESIWQAHRKLAAALASEAGQVAK
jgi:phosphoenolpyruvate carboxykinase (GTP)